ncbi:ketopantoate reductase family protein [Amycolatopsis sp. H20-H5]|uniref:ketopantoate reductase family protein n=1 Tax=Amycolatopsis sp. H20-H5 TaxID=3046309 RepID=UPI002DBB05FE|nr:2-dehydropantoate 2-reductase [Amycolatopsis sp. H20-H5]MEC3981400.1 2-dehydropantoate 2-reductase [Amycolatopsis sp. H20-H5]
MIVQALRFCVVGAGAIGGTVAASLKIAGFPVSVLARPGAHLDALRAGGLTVRAADSSATVRLPVATDAGELEPVDVVLVCVKAQDLPAVATRVAPLAGDGVEVVVVANGVPWWVPSVTLPGGRTLTAVDPGGTLLRTWPADRVLTGVAHLSAAVVEPGVIQRASGNQLLLGSPTGSRAEAAERIAAALTASGLDVQARPEILADVWIKLLGNLNLNPVSALTGATVDVILGDPLLRRLCARIYDEGKQVGRALGIPIEMDAEERFEIASKLGAFRTSMLHDLDRGKPLELDALVGAVTELATLLDVPAPATETVLGLLKMRATTR